MGKMIFHIALLTFSLVFQCSNTAVPKCSVSPANTVIYFDLEKLGQMALQHGYNDIIHSPILCEGGNDSECSKQQCCGDEVGCCYTDPNSPVKKCGCKQLGSKTCSYAAPLAILTNSKCNADNKTIISVCLSEKRHDEEKYISTKNTNLEIYEEADRSVTLLAYKKLRVTAQTIPHHFKQASNQILAAAGLSNQNDRCPLPSISSLIYLDIEKLSLIKLDQAFNGAIQSPQTCVEENGGDCSKQQCCHGEVGCCYTDQNKHIRKCGCKKIQDKTCSYPAPLVLLANFECENEPIRNTSACLRERRGNEEKTISENDSPMQSTVKLSDTDTVNHIIVILCRLGVCL